MITVGRKLKKIQQNWHSELQRETILIHPGRADLLHMYFSEKVTKIFTFYRPDNGFTSYLFRPVPVSSHPKGGVKGGDKGYHKIEKRYFEYPISLSTLTKRQTVPLPPGTQIPLS